MIYFYLSISNVYLSLFLTTCIIDTQSIVAISRSQTSVRALLPSMFTHTKNLIWRQELPVLKKYSHSANVHDSADIHRS